MLKFRLLPTTQGKVRCLNRDAVPEILDKPEFLWQRQTKKLTIRPVHTQPIGKELVICTILRFYGRTSAGASHSLLLTCHSDPSFVTRCGEVNSSNSSA